MSTPLKDTKELLQQVTDVFPYVGMPEDFKGAHGCTLEAKTNRLMITIWHRGTSFALKLDGEDLNMSPAAIECALRDSRKVIDEQLEQVEKLKTQSHEKTNDTPVAPDQNGA